MRKEKICKIKLIHELLILFNVARTKRWKTLIYSNLL